MIEQTSIPSDEMNNQTEGVTRAEGGDVEQDEDRVTLQAALKHRNTKKYPGGVFAREGEEVRVLDRYRLKTTNLGNYRIERCEDGEIATFSATLAVDRALGDEIPDQKELESMAGDALSDMDEGWKASLKS